MVAGSPMASRRGLEIVSEHGGRSRLITHGSDSPLSWSPDGRWILLVRDLRALYVGRSDGTGLRKMPSALLYAIVARPTWTPDSKESSGLAVTVLRSTASMVTTLGD